MRTAVFGLILAGYFVAVTGKLQYQCFFVEDGQRLEFCAPGLPRLQFLDNGDFQRTTPPDPCFDCMCDEEGLSCCECERGRHQG